MKKQILTKSNVCTELFKKLIKYRKTQFKIALPRFSLVLIVLTIYALIIVLGKAVSFLTVLIFTVGVLLSLSLILKIFIDYFTFAKAVRHRSFSITTDKLIYKERFNSNRMAENAVFEFRNFGRTYDIGSKFFDTTDEGVCDAAEVDDIFYLIIFKKQILSVYNTKFYELDAELQKELRT